MQLKNYFSKKTWRNMKLRRFPALFIILIFFRCAFQVSALHTSFCIRLPEDATLHSSYGASGQDDVASVGVEKFPSDIWSKYAFIFGDDDGVTDKTGTSSLFQQTNYDTGLKLELYPIRGRPVGDDPLAGWFRVELSIALEEAFSDFIKSFVLFATDEQANFIGTFENDAFPDETQDCPPSDATNHMIIPCGGVSKYDPFVSNVILYARNNSVKGPSWPQKYQQYWPIVPNYVDRYKLNFYYKFTMQALNKNKESHLIIRIIADPDETFTKEVLPGMENYKKSLLSATAHFKVRAGAIPGAADALPSDRTTLSCSHSSHTLTANEGSKKDAAGDKFYEKAYYEKHWQWYFDEYYGDQEAEIKRVGQGGLWPAGGSRIFDYTINQKSGCSAKFFGGRCDSTLCSKSNEGVGLWDPKIKRTKADFMSIPLVKSKKTGTCSCGSAGVHVLCYNESPETPKLFNKDSTSFYECFDHYKSEVGGKRCPMAEEEAKATQIKVIRRKPTNLTVFRVNGSTITHVNGSYFELERSRHPVDQRGVRLYGFGTLLYAVRKGHGVVMLIMSFFCVPVSIFISRYYKETFMSKRILYTRVWFQIHLQLVFWMCTFFVAGILLAIVGRGFLGVSLHPYGIMHRVLGWITVAIFIIIAATGGIRMYEDPWRSITIVMHWVIGYLFYIFNMLSVISSIHVPGSPIAHHDKSVDEGNVKEAAVGNYVYIVVSLWIIFELVMHVSMNFLLHSYDRWMKVQEPRKYLPAVIGVPIPVLKENSESDASGNGMRLITFWIYIGVAALCALLAGGICAKGKPSLERGLGPMSCTHEWNDSLNEVEYHYLKYQMRKTIDRSCQYF